MQANVNRLCKAYGFVNEWYGFMNKGKMFHSQFHFLLIVFSNFYRFF